MSKPAAGTAPLRWGTALLDPADSVEPDTTTKDHGWQSAQEPEHSFFNFWMNLIYLWAVYLDNITAEALTFTALETFSKGIVVTNSTANGAGALVTGNGTGAGATIVGGSSTGTGANITGGASSSSVGGKGLVLSGGLGTGSYGAALTVTHGNVDFTAVVLALSSVTASLLTVIGVASDGVSTTAAIGGTVTGGSGDAGSGHPQGADGLHLFGGDADSGGNGGIAGVFQGGLNGDAATYADAIKTLQGDIVQLNGNFSTTGNAHVVGQITVDGASNLNGIVEAAGNVVVGGNASVAGTLLVNGISALASISIVSRTTLTPLNGWAQVGSSATTLGYWKDPMGLIHLDGRLDATSSSTATIQNLPSGSRPLQNMLFTTYNGSNGTYTIQVTSAGVISCNAVGVATTISLDGIIFRTT